MNVLTVDHVSYYDLGLEGETCNDRMWVIARQKPNNEYEYKQAKITAQYWYNIHMYDCRYNISIHRKLKNLGFAD